VTLRLSWPSAAAAAACRGCISIPHQPRLPDAPSAPPRLPHTYPSVVFGPAEHSFDRIPGTEGLGPGPLTNHGWSEQATHEGEAATHRSASGAAGSAPRRRACGSGKELARAEAPLPRRATAIPKPTPTARRRSCLDAVRPTSTLTTSVPLASQEMNEISNDPVEGIDAAPVRLGMGVAGGRYGDTAWHGMASRRSRAVGPDSS